MGMVWTIHLGVSQANSTSQPGQCRPTALVNPGSVCSVKPPRLLQRLKARYRVIADAERQRESATDAPSRSRYHRLQLRCPPPRGTTIAYIFAMLAVNGIRPLSHSASLRHCLCSSPINVHLPRGRGLATSSYTECTRRHTAAVAASETPTQV